MTTSQRGSQPGGRMLDTPVRSHLEDAIDEEDPAAKNFHIRSALQYLEIEAPS